MASGKLPGMGGRMAPMAHPGARKKDKKKSGGGGNSGSGPRFRLFGRG
jgi:hypothetical protein